MKTDTWLEKDFKNPKKICEKLTVYFEGNPENSDIYTYLKSFGMYEPHSSSRKSFEKLKQEDFWGKTAGIYEKYRKMWNGPDIPVFIFPLDEKNSRLVREGKGKSGVSFKDKMFLFLTALEDDKELEALIVHEYHHVCRMYVQKKNPLEYTLLDSIILEGLAEYAVLKYCGETYISDWSKRYSKEDVINYWNKEIKENLNVKRSERLHDKLLFGIGHRPALIGYAIGFEIIKQHNQHINFSAKASFSLPSKNFVKFVNF